MLCTICKCGKRVRQGEICPCKKDRHKAYDRVYRNKDNASFYHSKAWRSMTNLCKARANGLDQYELVVNKRIVTGTLSHHIDELSDNKDRALDKNNLIWLSDKTHAFVHAEYNKGVKEKRKLQQILWAIVGGGQKSLE